MITNSKEAFDDETVLRKRVYEQVEPIITIARENMLTNCFKNDTIKGLHDEIAVMCNLMD